MFLGVLDLVSFFRYYRLGQGIWDVRGAFEYYDEMNLSDVLITFGIPILSVIMVLSLIASGVFLILGRKTGIVISYFQFPLRLMFLTLTFGFVLGFPGLRIDTLTYKTLLAFIAGLELIRLIFSIWVHRKYLRAS